MDINPPQGKLGEYVAALNSSAYVPICDDNKTVSVSKFFAVCVDECFFIVKDIINRNIRFVVGGYDNRHGAGAVDTAWRETGYDDSDIVGHALRGVLDGIGYDGQLNGDIYAFVRLMLGAMTVETVEFSEKYHSAESLESRKIIYEAAINRWMDKEDSEVMLRYSNIFSLKDCDPSSIQSEISRLFAEDQEGAILYMLIHGSIEAAKAIISMRMKGHDAKDDSGWGAYSPSAIATIASLKALKTPLIIYYDLALSGSDGEVGDFTKDIIIVNKSYVDGMFGEGTMSSDISGINTNIFGSYWKPKRGSNGEKNKKNKKKKRMFVDTSFFNDRDSPRRPFFHQDANEYE